MVRRGEDPEGGERSAWKGLVGPSGLGLDHSRISEIEKQVYDTLVPLVFRAEHPIPLSQFTQAACDVLLPVLPCSSSLTDHGFKSQWGRLNEFVCPRLAELRGLGDCGFNRTSKTVLLSIAADPPPGFTPTSSRAPLVAGGGEEEGAAGAGGARRRRERGGRGRSGGGGGAAGEPGGAAGAAGASEGGQEDYVRKVAEAMSAGAGAGAAAATPSPAAVPTPISLGQSGAGAGATNATTTTQRAPTILQPAAAGLCVYCGQSFHAIKQCPDFHTMLQSIYQAGYQQGVAAAQQVQQAQPVLPLQQYLAQPVVVPSPQLQYS